MVGIPRALSMAASATAARARVRRRPSPAVAVGAIFVLVFINVAVFMLPIDYRVFGAWAYPGVFVITFLANAAIALPIPYLAIVGQVARTAEVVPLVVLTAAVASVLGESVAYGIGRIEKDLFSDHSVYRRLQRLVGQPVRAGLLLFVLAVPLNPLFDVAGLAAGALGIPYRIFFWSVFVGRLIRFAILVWGVAFFLG
ncbi:MAG TPA: VTT domain-containing protein [Candidatus Limnocylindria bacterium]|nr:VTT domain-containing protein [Candidatus Limnocylindria bacterium]